MSRRLRVAIVGAGIAGTALAAHLAGRGDAIDGFERSTGSTGGAGLLLAPPALALLRIMGLEEAVNASGALVCGLRARRIDGGSLLHWDARRWGYPCMGLGIQRRALHEILLQASASTVTWHHGLGIDLVDADRGWITDANGERHGPYDLVVASDGAGSRLRAGQPELVTRTHRYEWTALSCLMRDMAAVGASPTLEQCFRGPHHVARWVVGATAEGQPLLCVSANVPAPFAAQFAEPETGLAELRRLGFARAAGLDELQPIGHWIALSARDVVLRRYFRQRLVFVGDAAHSLSPQLGQGARLALAGAANLAAALDRHPVVADASAAYERQQRRLATFYQCWCRWMTPVFQSPQRSALWIRDYLVPPVARLKAVERGVSRLLCGPAQAA